jgi:hypothetical protein
MKLPKIEVPVYKTKLILNNKEVTYRPFLVKEEKILLTAIQTDESENIIENLIGVVQNCMITDIDVSELPYFDFIDLFIKIRSKSLGEIVQIKVKDNEVKKSFDSEMNLDEVKVIKKKKIENKIQINNEIGVILKYPNIRTHLKFYFQTKKTKLTGDNLINIIVSSIEQIFDKENVYEAKNCSEQELVDFIESVPTSDISKISEFFDNMPKVIYEKEHMSPYTQKNIKVVVENILDFLI